MRLVFAKLPVLATKNVIISQHGRDSERVFMNIAYRYALIMSLCGVMSFGMASQPAASITQMKKELSAEKEQWAYVQRVLADELNMLQTMLNKLHRVGAYGAGIVGGFAFATGVTLFLQAYFPQNQESSNGKRLLMLSIISSGILTKMAVDKLLWNKAAHCAKALTSFISKWPKHKAKSPQALACLCDDLYAKRAMKNGGLTDKQAQALVEGILSLSVVAQNAVVMPNNVVSVRNIDELRRESAQWSYMQKHITNELQASKTVLNKLHQVGACGAGLVGGLAAALAVDYVSRDCVASNMNGLCLLFSGLGSGILIADIVDKLLENKSGVCLKALNSFIQKWPTHKAQTPQTLQGMFDELYVKRQAKNCGLTDVQAQQLIEGILALSVAAQVA